MILDGITLASLLKSGDLVESREGRGFAWERERSMCLREGWKTKTICKKVRAVVVHAHELSGLELSVASVGIGEREVWGSLPLPVRCDRSIEREQRKRKKVGVKLLIDFQIILVFIVVMAHGVIMVWALDSRC